ncbi:CBASS cGAMP-activated phospholipase [Mycobacterium sp. PSTR-4-N]|uniref:CBASS cGAMP-activated phospholipase n=1 Tax=Mycobacterium sp. PSTR-4-N TaxID=2917745 RepID=UPI001F149F03|nr:CBASS cGAMP-activated phospholipase [Mycobacterium sp. PSTR-4-N]MCG7597158.1 patatin-like phospholipase family protein [Mycobacterium sp. PSTR-4-N]
METDRARAADDRFRILALDGGGVRGAFTAAVLAEFEERTNTTCAERFDLITGTSTGGLLALALAMGHPARELCDLYRNNGRAIFPLDGRLSRLRGTLRQVFGSKFGQKALREQLTKVLGNEKLGGARTRLVIPAYDITTGRVFAFKTRHLERFRFDVDIEAVEIAMCTSAAPTYFPANLLPQRGNAAYVDGGIWANAPVMVGLVEAVGFLEVPLDRIDLLSVGTTSSVPSFSNELRSGLLGWGPHLSNLFMTAQAQGAVAMAQVLCRDRLHRINAAVPDDWMAMDNTKSVEKLIAAGRAEAQKVANYAVVSERFLNATAVTPFVPFGESSRARQV